MRRGVLLVLLALAVALALAAVGGRTGNVVGNPKGNPKSVRLGSLPADAALVFLAINPKRSRFKDVYVMNERGGNMTQITFNTEARHYEHAAVSPDRKRIVVNYWVPDPGGRPQPKRSLLWVLDLERQTETQLVPDFNWAGSGGVDWDQDGFIYFSAMVERSRRPRTDLYRIRYDGTGLQQLTRTRRGDEADVAVSDDGKLMTYILSVAERPRGYHEVWAANVDGSNARRIYKSGAPGVGSAHDPEFSPDNRFVVFSMVNPKYKNYRNRPGHNTAHDLYIVGLDGRNPRRITPEGAIQMIPDWRGDTIVYTEISEADNYLGMTMIDSSGGKPRRFGPQQAHSPKWIPPLAAGTGSAAVAPTAVAPTPTPTVPSAKATRAQIVVAQVLLAELGYDPGRPDGKMGRKTLKAIKFFQTSRGMTVNGKVTDALVEQLADTFLGN